MSRSIPYPVIECRITFPFRTQKHVDFVKRNCLNGTSQITPPDDRDSNVVHTTEGNFQLYYCDAYRNDGCIFGAVVVIGPNRLDGWYMGDWEREWKPRMVEMRKYPTYREFLNHTCIFKTNNINSWLI